MRDGEHIRHDMQQAFRDTLAAQQVPWVEVSGTREERVDRALAALAEWVPPGAGLAAPLPQQGTGRDIR